MRRLAQTGLLLLVFYIGVTPFQVMAQPVYGVQQDMHRELDTQQIRRWNDFVQNLLILHERLINQQVHVIKTRMGGDAHTPDFYKEFKYINKKSNRLISQLRWEKAYPDNLHMINVYVHDEYGRVSRDYSASYLVDYRQVPGQTLIRLHTYNGLLHATRSFDATGKLLMENCTGRYNAKEINIRLSGEVFDERRSEKIAVLQSDTYKQCFKGLPVTAEKYLIPR